LVSVLYQSCLACPSKPLDHWQLGVRPGTSCLNYAKHELLFGAHGEVLKVRSNGARGNRVGELLALQWKAINWDAKTISFSKGFWRGRLQESTKTGQDHVRHISKTLERVLADHRQISKTLDPMILFSVDPMKMPGRMIRMTWEGKCSIPLSTCSMRCSFRAFDPARTSLKLSQMPFRVFCWQQRV